MINDTVEQNDINNMKIEKDESIEILDTNIETEISNNNDNSTSVMEHNENEEEEEGMIVEKEEVVDKSLCQICKTNKWKYTCPKCLMHTCSLVCVKTHKKDFNCDGKRDKVKYVSMNEYNENNLRNGIEYNICYIYIKF